RDPLLGHPEVEAAMEHELVELLEGAFVQQELDPLARRELAFGVLALAALRPPAVLGLADLLAEGREPVAHERLSGRNRIPRGRTRSRPPTSPRARLRPRPRRRRWRAASPPPCWRSRDRPRLRTRTGRASRTARRRAGSGTRRGAWSTSRLRRRRASGP